MERYDIINDTMYLVLRYSTKEFSILLLPNSYLEYKVTSTLFDL